MEKDIQKIPITVGLAFHLLSYNKQQNNPCLKQFMHYLTSYGKNTSKQLALKLRQKLYQMPVNDKQRRDLVQICNLQLDSIDEVEEILPQLFKSKNIIRSDIEDLLAIIRLGK